MKKDLSEYRDELTNLKTILLKANYEIEMLKEELSEYKTREGHFLSFLDSSQIRKMQESVLLEGLPQPADIQDNEQKVRLKTEDSPRSGLDQIHINRIERRLQSVLNHAAVPNSRSGSHHREVNNLNSGVAGPAQVLPGDTQQHLENALAEPHSTK